LAAEISLDGQNNTFVKTALERENRNESEEVLKLIEVVN
jgi:hypothetical protein